MLKDLSILSILRIGGPVMYLLILCSIVSIAAIIDRIVYYFKRSQSSRIQFMNSIRQQFAKGDLKKIEEMCRTANAPYANVVHAAVTYPNQDEKEVAEAMERQILIETTNLERRTTIIGTIGSTAVYIGLLGTVWGIIRTFRDMSQAGSGGISVVIGGISESLVCTAAGLIVSIPAVMAYNYFFKKVNSFVIDMELTASEMESLIRTSKKK